MGWNIARYGALINGQLLTSDFRAFTVATLTLVGLYAALLALVPAQYAWPEGTRLLLVAVLTTHALAEPASRVLDRWLFDPVAGSLRRRLRELADLAVRRPDPIETIVDVREELEAIEAQPSLSVPDERELRVLVESALRRLNDVPALSRHRLVGATPSTRAPTGSRIDAGNQLRRDLVEAIDHLRPEATGPGPATRSNPVGGAWLHFLVLHEAYVQGRPNKQIMQRYALSESTFHRVRRRAVDAVATELHERLGASAAQPDSF
jgi:hypothetical protein